ncbi:MAG: uroporphyrinogen decarboxylase family protein [Fimbriimonadaceae bacterium]|nr:uroporphyrinogen decarboxylase family protein [Fimbriimonadaceae bacterium]
MTERQRFLATMRYEPRDRCPIMDFNFWDETLPAWRSQGLPDHVRQGNSDDWFGMDSMGETAWVHNGLLPRFPVEVIRETDTELEMIDDEGRRIRKSKVQESIPMYLDHLLQDRESWERHFLPRLRADDPARLPEDLDQTIARLNSPEQERLVTVHAGSLFGWIRDWMGVEGVGYLVYDDPELFEEMVETVCQVQETVLGRLFEAGLKADAAQMWEDMCYSGGPLLTPSVFQAVLVPRYRRIADLLRRNGVDLIWIDCDGRIDLLVTGWLEAGINIMFPLEVGTWNADPAAFRREYGRDLRLMGGFDKRVLEAGPAAIDAEIDRLTPLVEEGGFIPFPDHRVPPDVPYGHFLHYVRRVREVWGLGLNLKPCPALESAT